MCVFCDIVAGKIPSYKIFENEKTYAFLDIACDAYGHTLVIPKKHFENILDIEKESLSDVMETVQKVSKHYVEDCGFTGVNLINCTGKDAEQSVFHLHFHIIPRKENDNMKVYPDLIKKDLNLADIEEKLKISD